MNNTNINKINELLSSFSEQQRVRARLEMELKDISVDKEKIGKPNKQISTSAWNLSDTLNSCALLSASFNIPVMFYHTLESVTQSLSTKIKDLDSALQIQRKV